MAIDIIVIRGAGSHQGPDIIDAYITSEQVAIQRGANQLDLTASGLQEVDVVVPYDGSLRPGQVVQVNDTELEEMWYSKIKSVSISSAGVETLTTLTVLRPTSFRIGT